MRVWQVTVESSEGQKDVGGIDIYGDIELTPRQIADRLAEITWRIAADLAAEQPECEAVPVGGTDDRGS